MLSVMDDVLVTASPISMRLDAYNRSSGPVSQHLPARKNTERELMHIAIDLAMVNSRNATVDATILMHVIYMLVP